MLVADTRARHESKEKEGEDDKNGPDVFAEEDSSRFDAGVYVIFSILTGIDCVVNDSPAAHHEDKKTYGLRSSRTIDCRLGTYQTVPRKNEAIVYMLPDKSSTTAAQATT